MHRLNYLRNREKSGVYIYIIFIKIILNEQSSKHELLNNIILKDNYINGMDSLKLNHLLQYLNFILQ